MQAVTQRPARKGRVGKVHKPAPKHVEPTIDLKEDGKEQPVSFFSRYRNDVLQVHESELVAAGVNRFINKPGPKIEFRDRGFITDDPEKIEFLRKHQLYGREIFEFGVHDDKIKLVDDSGVIERLEKLSRLGRIAMSRYRKGLAE